MSPRNTWGRRHQVTSLVTGGLLVLAACSGGSGSGTATCPAPRPASGDELARLPRGLDLTPVGTVTAVDVPQPGYLAVTVDAKGELPRLTAALSRALERAGYTIAGTEDGGVGADVFFTRGELTAGAAKLTPSECPGRATITVTLSGPGSSPAP
ncbi:hypothetical protein C3Y87_07840 [Carbonactinospora thermoautotrophica]|uniref:hypothetical protein n=1 Tax=Carbonactinospora thermoautotrophica TaxID=1469144 RepID=UPI00226D828C|nr:hypothetical protein [Carbonactinospora thermoautotrophica]MCX9191325.1 hypothetical protein [Carbonactinospora thermoautotrophica]